jgi:hypothetical protein
MLRGALTGVLSHSKQFSWLNRRNANKYITVAITTIAALAFIHMSLIYDIFSNV